MFKFKKFFHSLLFLKKLYFYNVTNSIILSKSKEMAAILQASIYGVNANAIGTNQGTIMGFPTSSILIRPVDHPTTFNGVTMASAIELRPTGLNQPSQNYYSAQTVSALITTANT